MFLKAMEFLLSNRSILTDYHNSHYKSKLAYIYLSFGLSKSLVIQWRTLLIQSNRSPQVRSESAIETDAYE